MNKVKILLCLIMATIIQSFYAQTQQGYVKTKGRMVNGKHVPGQGLKGATVSIKDRTPVVVQSGDGSFSFPIPAQTFMLQGVQKNGYELVDIDAIKKPYNHSTNPIYLIMETPEQQMEDLLGAQEQISKTLREQLKKAREEIQRLKDGGRITEEQYQQRIAQLMTDQQNNQQLIADMAKEYAQLDYDQMDELDQRISDAILNGRLTEADSLLHSKGDMKSRVAEIRREQQAEAQRETEIAQEQADLAEAKAGTQKRLEDVANDCYRKFEIFKLQQLNDSSAYYLKLRASLDTTNVEWQFEAGMYLNEHPFWYNDRAKTESISYFQQALDYAKRKYGSHPITAKCYHNLGETFHLLGDYHKAIESFSEELSILNSYYGEASVPSVSCLENIGRTYTFILEYDSSTLFFEKGYKIAEKLRNNCDNTDRSSIVDDSMYFSFESIIDVFLGPVLDYSFICSGRTSLAFLRDIASNYYWKKDYPASITYYQKALELSTTLFGYISEDAAMDMSQIADEYMIMGNYEKAIHYYESELYILNELEKKDFHESYTNDELISFIESEASKFLSEDDNDWDLISQLKHSCNMCLGNCYKKLGDYDKAIELFIQQISSRKKDNNNFSVFREIGKSYFLKGEPDSAIVYYDKMLTIRNDLTSIPAYDNKSLKSIQLLYIIDDDVIALLSDSSSTIYPNFFSRLVFVCHFFDEDTPASQQGLIGDYVLLEFADWDQNTKVSLFDKNAELWGKPKDILIMKNGQITQHHFDNTIGAQLKVLYVGEKEKQRINTIYEEWKKQNRNQP